MATGPLPLLDRLIEGTYGLAVRLLGAAPAHDAIAVQLEPLGPDPHPRQKLLHRVRSLQHVALRERIGRREFFCGAHR